MLPVLKSYAVLKKESLSASDIVEWHTTSILSQISRKISPSQSFKNPWTIKVSRSIHYSVFQSIFKAIRDFSSDFGFTTQVTHYKGKKSQQVKTIEITFYHLGAFIHHMLQLCNGRVNVKGILTKNFKGNNCGAIIASNEKPIVICYSAVTDCCTFSLHYEVTNRYGHVVSF